ncbi:MAG: hypothetical protein KAT31_18035, partial [Bacteroidales bacterium]|nr:hypothetical protein [Bacteroidales bacterium]
MITQDADGFVWVNTMEGLNRIDLRDFSFESYHGDLSGQLVFDESGPALWIAGNQLKKYDLKSSKLSYYDSGPVNSIILDNEKNIWLGTGSGALIYRKGLNEMITLQDYLEQEKYSGVINDISAG